MDFFRVKRTLTAFLLLIVVGCGTDEPQIEVIPPEENQSLEQYIESQSFSGAIYIAKGEEIVLSRGFGLANRQTNSENTQTTIFRIGSVTKQFTAASILLLQERGLLTVDDPVSLHLSNFPNGEDISLYHLLTHTSGLPNYTELSAFERVLKETLTPEQVMELFIDLPLDFQPGSQFSYSNSGYIVLGAVIEQVTGMTYQAFIDSEIYQPLNMFSSGYASNESSDVNVAKGYDANGGSTTFIDMSLPYAAGALVSSVIDLAKWDKALYASDFLTEGSIAQMFSPNLSQYGLGWRVTQIAGTSEQIHVHGGNISGFSSVIVRFPETEKVIIILSNIDNYPVNQLAVNINNLIEAE